MSVRVSTPDVGAAAIVVVSVARMVGARRYHRLRPAGDRLHRWAAWAFGTILLQGLLLGSLSLIWLEPAAPEVEEPLVVESFKYDETELLGMDKQQVALQLAVLSSDASLQRFNKAYPQLGSLVYQRNWQGKTQWVILLAPFSNAASANQQLAQLPEALRAGGPFVKRLQAVQTEINALRRNQQSVPE